VIVLVRLKYMCLNNKEDLKEATLYRHSRSTLQKLDNCLIIKPYYDIIFIYTKDIL